MKRYLYSSLTVLTSCLLLSTAADGLWAAAAGVQEPTSVAAQAPKPTGDVIARVGDQNITFGEINTMLNSSGVVGLSLPAVGTRERDTVRITLLDKFISANLLYLDALKQGLDKDPAYVRELERFSAGTLAGLYRQRDMAGPIPVSEEEIQAFVETNVVAGTELSDELRASIEASLRRDKLKERMAAAYRSLRDGVELRVHEDAIGVDGDAGRADTEPVAQVGEETITWGEVKERIIAAGKGAAMVDQLADERDARLAALQNEVDLRLMAQKGRAAGLDRDPVYLARYSEFRKTRLINLQRARLAAQFEPSEVELKAYYEQNRGQIMQPESRQVQMVVLKSKDEAEEIKAQIEAGKMTMYQAARDRSITPTAKEDLGEIGWVNKGTALPALDEAIFAAGPGEIGGPVETPAGWHLVMVQDVKEAKNDDFADLATRKVTKRKYIHEKLDKYVVNLRKNEFQVEVFEDVLLQLAQQEADAVKRLAEKAQAPDSVTQERVKELQKLIKP